MEKFEKNFERISSHHRNYMSNVPLQSENQQNQHRSSAEKPGGQGCVETKLLELKHLLDQKNLPNEKPP